MTNATGVPMVATSGTATLSRMPDKATIAFALRGTNKASHHPAARDVAERHARTLAALATISIAADKLETALKRVRQQPEVLILRMRQVLAMDATGLNALEDLCGRMHRKGKHLILSGPHAQPLFTMEKAGFLDRVGRPNVCATFEEALARAKELLPNQAKKNDHP